MEDPDLKRAAVAIQVGDVPLTHAQEMDTRYRQYEAPSHQFTYDTSYGASRTGFRD